jgi:hypothetical protein
MKTDNLPKMTSLSNVFLENNAKIPEKSEISLPSIGKKIYMSYNSTKSEPIFSHNLRSKL